MHFFLQLRLSHLSSASISTLDEDEYGVQERRDARKQETSNAANLFGVESNGRETERNDKDYCKGEMSQTSSYYEEVENPYDTCYDDDSYLKDYQYEMEPGAIQSTNITNEYYDDVANILANDLENSEINENDGTE